MSVSKKELLVNATHWLNQAKSNGLTKMKIGAVFIFFDETGEGSAVCTATIGRERLKTELKALLKKIEERSIIMPGENQ